MTKSKPFPHEKLKLLYARLADMKRVLVALSGGIDSCFLLKAAQHILGDNVVAATAVSPIHLPEDIADAEASALSCSAHHLKVDIDILNNSSFTENTPDRCYWCKKTLYHELQKQAAAYKIPYILDGSHADDVSCFRPGMKAVEELGIQTPLREIGFSKEEIRASAQHLGLSLWNRPARTCRATRIPYGTPVTQKTLDQISGAETFLNSIGLSQVRVRHHGSIARIEIPAESMNRMAEPGQRQAIVCHLKKLGYVYVTVDLEGYRSGSMDEGIS